jgi:hypothetical protein
LFFLHSLQGSRAAPLNRWDILQGLDISGRTSPESSGTHPLRDAYGTLTGQTIRTHANSNQRQFMQIHSKRRWSMWSIAHQCQSCQSIQNCVSPLKAMPIHANPFKVHQSTQTDSIIPTLANPSKNVQIHTNWRESIKTHFNLC